MVEPMETVTMNVTEQVVPNARLHVEEIAILMPQILTQMVDKTVEMLSHRSQNAQCLCLR